MQQTRKEIKERTSVLRVLPMTGLFGTEPRARIVSTTIFGSRQLRSLSFCLNIACRPRVHAVGPIRIFPQELPRSALSPSEPVGTIFQEAKGPFGTGGGICREIFRQFRMGPRHFLENAFNGLNAPAGFHGKSFGKS